MNRKLKEIKNFWMENFPQFQIIFQRHEILRSSDSMTRFPSPRAARKMLTFIESSFMNLNCVVMSFGVCFRGVKILENLWFRSFSLGVVRLELRWNFPTSSSLSTQFWRFSILLWVKFYVVSFASTLHSEKYILPHSRVHRQNRIY